MSGTLTPFDIAMGGAESSNNPFIGYHNLAKSTAAGQFGITDTTWNGLARNHPELGLTDANRLDPLANIKAQHALTAENTTALGRYGVADPTDPSALGLASFFGPQGAAGLLKADPNEKLGDVLNRTVGFQNASKMIQANPGVLDPNKTVGQVVAWNASRLGGGIGAPNMSSQVSAPGQPQASAPGVAPWQTVQASPPPPMPSDYGAVTTPPPGAVTVDRTGHQGDPLIALGMGMMGGNGWHDAMARGGEAYGAAQQAAMQNNRLDATLANDAANRQFQAPLNAADVAAKRAQGWAALNAPNTITAEQALQANTQGRQQDVTMADAQARNNYMMAMTKGAPQQFVVPGSSAEGDQTWEVTRNAAGQPTYRNLATGQTAPNLPTGAQPLSTYNAGVHHAGDLEKASMKDESSLLAAGTNAKQQLVDLQKAQSDASQPGALAGPGMVNSIGRTIDQLTGQNIFGDVGQEQIAKMGLGAANWGKLKSATQGTGRLMASEIGMLQQYGPNMATDPSARAQVFQTLQAPLQRQAAVADAWAGLSPAEQTAIKRSGGFNNWVANQNTRLFAQQQASAPAVQPQAQAPQAAPAPLPRGMVTAPPTAQPDPGSSGAPVDLNNFWK